MEDIAGGIVEGGAASVGAGAVAEPTGARASAAAEAGGPTIEGESEKEGMAAFALALPFAGAVEAVAFGVVWGDADGEGAIWTAGVVAVVVVVVVVSAGLVIAISTPGEGDEGASGAGSRSAFTSAVLGGGCCMLGDGRHRARRVSMRGGLRMTMYTTEAKMSDQPNSAMPCVVDRGRGRVVPSVQALDTRTESGSVFVVVVVVVVVVVLFV
ncbi:hypothetical protein F4824DRAFT_451375 [Ustulina deusta]|nr:hypothetical protein F4824DRAFT_451375 [Ustulina deusta]